MSVLAAVILAVALGPSFAVIAFAVALLARRRRPPLRTLSDREVMDALAPFGADISVWPSRAPRNGSTHDDESTAA
jgi:hypothetical protein